MGWKDNGGKEIIREEGRKGGMTEGDGEKGKGELAVMERDGRRGEGKGD